MYSKLHSNYRSIVLCMDLPAVRLSVIATCFYRVAITARVRFNLRI